MNKANALADRQMLVGADLAGEPLLLYRTGYLVRELVLRLLGEDDVPRVLYSSDNNQTTRAFIAQGFGVGFAIVPEGGELPVYMDPELVQVRVTDAPAVELCCAYLTGRYLPRLLSKILAEAAQFTIGH